MSATRLAAAVLLAGAGVFFAAAFAPVSRVFAMRGAEERLRFLEAHATAWRRAQPLFAAGAAISAVGLLRLGLALHDASRTYLLVAGAAAAVGAVPWALACGSRGRRIEDFVNGTLPGWHYQVYVWLSLVALALTGAGLLASDYPTWIGWFCLGATAVFTLVLLVFRDLPPFVLYLVTGVVGVVALTR